MNKKIVLCFTTFALMLGVSNYPSNGDNFGKIAVNSISVQALEDSQEHIHAYESEITKQATCTESGIRSFYCQCGDTYTEEISPLGHNFDKGKITKNATVSQEGEITYTCSVCGETKVEAIEKLEPQDISAGTVTLSKNSYIYNGLENKPTVTVKLNSNTLVSGKDYNVTYFNNISAGKGVVIVTGINDYKGSISKSFTISKVNLSNCTVSGIKDSYTYNGKAQKPTITVKNGTKTLEKDKDYTVSYKNSTNVGTATVTITGKSNYSGTISKTFKISAASIKKAKVSGIKSSYAYTANTIKPNIVVKLGNKTLKNKTDYTISYKNNTKVGKATITIKGKGNYGGTITKTFKINAAAISSCKISGIKSYYKYDGKVKKPSPKVTIGKKTLKASTDYTVSYKNNKNLGTATVTIKGKGNLKGSVTKKFKIVRMGWYTNNGYKYYYNNKGQKLTGKKTIDDTTYYFNSKGVMQTGWVKSQGEYYYFDRSSGKMAKNTTVDGIKLNKKGTAAKTDYNVSKIETMRTARKIMTQITNPTDSVATKRYKCFKWVFQFPYHRFRLLSPIYETAGWEMSFANDIFKYKSGCCVSEASATAFLFKECGCKNVCIAHDTGHAWVEADGRSFDPLFAEARGMSNYYNIPSSQFIMYAFHKRYI